MTATEPAPPPTATPQHRVRRHLTVRGAVQGVGFRPFVYTLAEEHGLTGWVTNDADGVVTEVEGPAAAVDAFTDAIGTRAPRSPSWNRSSRTPCPP